MWKYFRYVELNVSKKKSTWVAAGIFWLYLSIILIFVPAIIKMSPTTIWNNVLIDVQSFTLIVLSVVCAITTVVIFRDGRDDGTELIITSKPISRWKVIFIKFFVFVIHSVLIIVIGMIIMCFILTFGKITITNPYGMDYSLLIPMEEGLLLASGVIVIFFGSIAILISAIAGKIGIMVSTIGLSVVLNLVYLVSPIIAITPEKYIESEYSVEIDNHRYMGLDGNMHNAISSANNIGNNWEPDYQGTQYFATKGIQNASGAGAAYINVSQQISTLFHAFGSKDESFGGNQPFGENIFTKYWLQNYDGSTNNVKPMIQTYKTPGQFSRPWIRFEQASHDLVPYVKYTLAGTNISSLMLWSLAGASWDSFARLYFKNGSILDQMNTTVFYDYHDLQIKNQSSDLKDFIAALMDEDPTSVRRVICSAVLEDETSPIYHGKNLGINVELPSSNASISQINILNNAMNVIYLKLLYQLRDLCENDLWEEMDCIWGPNDYKANSTMDDLIPFNDQSVLEELNRDNHTSRLWELNHLLDTNCKIDDQPPFDLTQPGDNEEYRSSSDKRFEWVNGRIDGTECFSDIYFFGQKPYYTDASVTLFWSIFSLFLFAAAVLVYARTDFK